MKLLIKKKYFDQIKSGEKQVDYRDAHITFICEETKEQLRKEILYAFVTGSMYPDYPDVLTKGELTLAFRLGDAKK